MADLDVGSMLYAATSLLVAVGLGAIVGFFLGIRMVLRMMAEVQPVVRGFLGGKGKMGLWDIAGMVLSKQGNLGGLLGGKP